MTELDLHSIYIACHYFHKQEIYLLKLGAARPLSVVSLHSHKAVAQGESSGVIRAAGLTTYSAFQKVY